MRRVWYEVIAFDSTGLSIAGSSQPNISEAATVVQILSLLMLRPDVDRIFVRQHLRRGGFRLVNGLSWKRSDERRVSL